MSIAQLCITIAHFIEICTLPDLVNMAAIWMEHFESNKQSWIRVINRMLPEKADSLLKANTRLKLLLTDEVLAVDQRNATQTLLSCFVSITEYDN